MYIGVDKDITWKKIFITALFVIIEVNCFHFVGGFMRSVRIA